MNLFKNIFNRNYDVQISDPDLAPVRTKIRTSSLQSAELGGYLIGYKKSGVIHIVKVMHCANTTAFERKYKFKAKYQSYAKEIRKIYTESGGKHKIIGEWHTHPSRTVTPSQKDEDTVWKKKWLNAYFIAGIVTHDPGLMNWDEKGERRTIQMHVYYYTWGLNKKRRFLKTVNF